MKYDYDILVIGLGPAGMAVSLMGSAMGLKVCAIEKHAVGGECMNVGCIPSKALLRMGKTRAMFDKLTAMQLDATPKPKVLNPFGKIAESLKYISDKKTMGMFAKVEMVYQQGAATFINPQTVEVAGRKITAKRIFLCVGTRPEIPNFPGIDEIEPLTNENMFQLEKVPERLTVFGSGAIACEMAQAFSRLGSSVDLVFRGSGLMWREDSESMKILEDQFLKEGIRLHRNCTPTKFSKTATGILIETNTGNIETDRVLCALGRRFDFADLKLENAGVACTNKGITINKYLQTSKKHIYACGDCNGQHQFSHAAMHQGMIALMNCMIPSPFKYRYDKYVVPWTVFTEPQISRVGKTGKQLDELKIKHRTITAKYEDYGAAIAESVDIGHVKAHVSPLLGKIIGVTIVGEGSGEMINEWALAMQNRLGMYHLMMQQHSFPTMGFLTKRVAETWMMENMESSWLKWLCRKMFGY